MKYIIICLLAISSIANAATKTYSGAGIWDANGSWLEGTKPTSSDDVTISSGTCVVGTGVTAVCKSLTLSGAANLTLQSATALSVTNSFTMSSTGTLTVGSASSANLVPFPTCGSVSITSGAVLYTANNVSQIINTSITYFNLTLARTSKTVSSTLNISNNLSVGTGISLTTTSALNVGAAISGVGSLLLSSGSTLDVKGNVTITTMTCDANSTVIYSGTGTQTAKVTAYGTLRKSPNSNIVNMAAGFSATTLEILTGTFSMASGTVSGNVQLDNGATLSISTSFPTYGSTSLGSTSTVTYTGSSGLIEPLTYGNLSFANSSTKAMGVGNYTIQGNFTLGTSATILLNSSGTVEVQGNVIGSATSTLGVADGYLLLRGTLASAIILPITSGTVEYGSSLITQVIQAKQYHNLILSGSSDKTLSSSGTIQLTGDLTNSTSGTITSTSTTVEFNSSLSGQTIPAFTFFNLKVSESDKVLSGDVIVTNSLDLNGTFITTGSNSVRMLNTNSTAITSLDPSTSYITGILARNFANGTSTLPYPLGENNHALPVAATIVLTSGGGTSTSNGYLAISSTFTDPASYPSFDDANFKSATNVCNRYWTVQNIGYTYSDLQIGMRFLNPDDVGVDVSDASTFLSKVYNGSTWSAITVSDPQGDTSTVTGLTIPTTGNSIDIWLGEESGGLCQSTGTGLNWNSAATWSCARIPLASDTVEIGFGHTITLDGSGNALSLLIDGTVDGTSTTDVIVGTGGITVSSTGSITRSSGNPNLATSGNLTINNGTTIPTDFILELTGNNKFILSNQSSLSIPRLTINAPQVFNKIPTLTVGTDLGSNTATNTLVQDPSSVLTISDGFTFITIDASATGSSVIYDRGFTTQIVNRGTYYDLTLTSNAVTTKVTSLPLANVTVANSLTLQKGSATTHSLDITSTSSSLTGTGATFTMDVSTVVNVGATSSATSITFPSTFSTYSFDPTSTVSYNTDGDQPVAGITGYANLVITTGTANAIKTLNADATTTNLTLTNGTGTATFSLGTSTLGLSGIISGTGTLSCPDGSTFNYNSNSASQLVLANQYANLSFTNAGTKTLPTSGVLVSGNLTSNSSLSVPTNSLLTLNGTTSDQVVTTNLSFYDLLKSGAATVSFTTSNTTVTNSFVVQDGSGLISPAGLLTIADGAYLMDNSAGSSSFAVGSAGNVTIKKTATSGAKRAYLLSGSTTAFTETELKSGQTYQVLRYETDGTPNNLSSNFTRSCDGGTAKGSINGLYLNTTGTLSPGRGYSVTQNAGTKTITLVGNPNFGSISVNSLLTASIDRESVTYNWCPINNRLAILGNPYPSSIDWAAVLASSTNLNTTCKIWNGTNYTDLVGTGTIPTGQGFFVRVLSSPGTLTFNNSHRLSSSTSLLRSYGKTLALALTAANEEFSDILSVNFNNEASEDLDSKYDSYDLPGIEEVPCFSSIVNGQQLSTNQLPEPNDNKVIPVYIKAPYSGSYSLSVKEYNLTDKNLTAYFVDKKEQKYSDLSQANTFEIDLDKGESNDRFEIQFRTSESAANIFSDYNSINKLYATEEAGNLIVSYNDDIKSGSIFVYDINGRLIGKQTEITPNSGRYNMLSNISNSQCYVIKLVGDSKTRTLKFIR